MIESIKDSIIESIREAWPDAVVYQEAVPQGFVRPSFSVFLRSSAYKAEFRTRGSIKHSFIIHYFAPDSPDMRSECEAVLHGLIEALEFIRGGKSKLRMGADIDARVSDEGVLTFSISYTVNAIRKRRPDEKMEELIHKEVIKDEQESGNSGGPAPCRDCSAVFCIGIDQGGGTIGHTPNDSDA